MRRTERTLVALALAASLAACAASSPRSSNRNAPTRDQEAASVQVKMGQGYLAQGELETARDKLQRALELDPDSADAHTLMAVLQERISRPAMAEKHYRRAVELKPDNGSVNNNYGTFLCGTGRFEEAQTYFDRAVEDPFYRTPAVAYANAGFCALKAGQPEQAERMLRAALDLEPTNATVLFEMSRLHFERGDLMRARAFLQRFEATAVVDPQALDLGARIEQQRGDSAAAGRYRKQLQEQFPEFTPATGNDGSGS